MDVSLVNAVAVQQTTMAANIFGIVLNDLALHDNSLNLTWRNPSVWSRHLTNGMGEK